MAADFSERLLDISEGHVLRSDVSRLDSLRDVVLFSSSNGREVSFVEATTELRVNRETHRVLLPGGDAVVRNGLED